jgi:hypothetical protein
MVRPPTTLDNRIRTVENALGTIRDLESYLDSIKQDMIKTERATLLLSERHAQAKKLDAITQEQFEAIKTALQTESWFWKIFGWVMAFVSGVASSYLASALRSWLRQRRALE